MGIFDQIKNYFTSRELSRVERASKLIKNAKAIRDDRWAALEYLSEDVKDPNSAIPHLLHRFEYSLEHGINDTREKELALKGVARFGEAAVPFIKSWLQQTTRIAWPIKVLKELNREQELVDCLKSALNYGDISFDQAAVDKNYDVLCYLREYEVPEIVQDVSHFLKDPDERVRFAAVEFLINQNTAELVKPALEVFLTDDSAENRRIHQAVVEAFVSKGWKVENSAALGAAGLANSLSVNSQGQLIFRV